MKFIYIGFLLFQSFQICYGVPIDREKFNECFNSPQPEWILQQLEADFDQYLKKGIFKDDLNETFDFYKEEPCFIRIIIDSEGITFDGNGVKNPIFNYSIEPAFRKLKELVELPHGTFFLSMHDGLEINSYLSPECRAPIFAFAKTKHADCVVLIPDRVALCGYNHYAKNSLSYEDKNPWKSKVPKIFWRGGCTGKYFSNNNYFLGSRYQVVYLAKEYPEDFNIKFTLLYNSKTLADKFREDGVLEDVVPLEDHLEYKYLLDVDGNSCTYTRNAFILFSNSLLFKQLTHSIQWYYKGTQPFVHYIPVAFDFSDMKERLEWARSHDEKAKEIADNATQFARQYLSNEWIFFYLYNVLKMSSEIQITSLQKEGQ